MGILPKLPAKAAYILIKNHARQNVLSLQVLRNIQNQIEDHLRSPTTGRVLTLPPFSAQYLPLLQDQFEDYPDFTWLTNSAEWHRQFAGMPSVLVLRSAGPIFCAGYDFKEMAKLTNFEVKEVFLRCRDVVTLIRQSPIPIVCPIQGLAEGPGFQLATATDFPIALANTPFGMSGMRMGLPSLGAAAMASRRLPSAMAYRMFSLGDHVTAKELGPDLIDVVDVPEHAEAVDTATRDFEARVRSTIEKLATETPAQAQAVGKWAFWSQLAIPQQSEKGDSYDTANEFAANVMAMSSRSGPALEGMNAWKEKRKPDFDKLPEETDSETAPESEAITEEQMTLPVVEQPEGQPDINTEGIDRH